MSRPLSLNKLYGLQVIRAVAAILVAWAHVLFEVRDMGFAVWHSFNDHIKAFGTVGVDLFFVLSGLVVSLSAARQSSPKQFLLRRIMRVIPFYWAAVLVYVVVAFTAGGGLTKAQVLYLPFLVPHPTKPFLLPTFPNSWTLVNELFFYFCLYLGLLAGRERARAVCASIILVLVALHVGLATLFHRNLPILNYYGNPIALEFLFGMLIGQVLDRRPLGATAIKAVMAVGISLFALTALAGIGEIWNPTEIRISPGLAFRRVAEWGIPASLVVLATASLKWAPRSRWGHTIVYLGDACYSIYLMQWLPIAYGKGLLRTTASAVGADLAVLLFVVVSVAFGALVYRFVEKPLTERLTKAVVGRGPKGTPPLAEGGIAPTNLEPDPKL